MYINDEVVELLRQGDEKVFEQFYFAISPMMYEKIVTRIKNKEDTKEMVQDIMLSIPSYLRKHLEVNGQNLMYHVVSILNMEIFKYMRVVKRQPENMYVQLNDDIEYDDYLSKNRVRFTISELKSVLSKLEYNVLVMKYVDKLSYQEIAEEINMYSSRTIRRVLKQGLTKTKKYYCNKYGK